MLRILVVVLLGAGMTPAAAIGLAPSLSVVPATVKRGHLVTIRGSPTAVLSETA